MNMKALVVALPLSLAVKCGQAALPSVEFLAFDAKTPVLEVSYSLDAPAIVAFDVQTNAGGVGWASIGAANVVGDGSSVRGDAFKAVAAGARRIRWRSRRAWRDHEVEEGGLRAVLTIYPVDDPPDYLVVDLAKGATDRIRYYPSVAWLPGGLLTNLDYRTTKLVLRKCAAEGVAWTMGQVMDRTVAQAVYGTEADCDRPHAVTLTNDFYIGVFEMTQKQWETVAGGFVNFDRRVEGDLLPVHNLSYAMVRETANDVGDSAAYWPAAPGENSFLGKLRALVEDAVAFDLPTVAQWEFAARAGTSSAQWPNGAAYKPQLGAGDSEIPASFSREALGPEPCGSHEPNRWDLYDMNGSVWEWCLDWYEEDITGLGGRLNVDPADGAKTLSGATGVKRCIRGGSWTVDSAEWIRHTLHWGRPPTEPDWNGSGFRVACPATLK